MRTGLSRSTPLASSALDLRGRCRCPGTARPCASGGVPTARWPSITLPSPAGWPGCRRRTGHPPGPKPTPFVFLSPPCEDFTNPARSTCPVDRREMTRRVGSCPPRRWSRQLTTAQGAPVTAERPYALVDARPAGARAYGFGSQPTMAACSGSSLGSGAGGSTVPGVPKGCCSATSGCPSRNRRYSSARWISHFSGW